MALKKDQNKPTKKKGVPEMENPPKPPRKKSPTGLNKKGNPARPVTKLEDHLNPKPKQTRSTRKMTIDLFKNICNELSQSYLGLSTLCKAQNSSAPAFFDLMENEAELSEFYTRARDLQAEFLFDLQRETVFERNKDSTPFTGGNFIQRDRLIFDALKWQTEKLKPKKYGTQKIDLNHSGEIELTQITGMIIENNLEDEDQDKTE